MANTIGELVVLDGGGKIEEGRQRRISEIWTRARHERVTTAAWAFHREKVCTDHVRSGKNEHGDYRR